jgi:hypothetical protein
MDAVREAQRLRSRQNPTPSSTENGGSNIFLDLLSNPFIAAVSVSFSIPDSVRTNILSFKQMPSGHP